MDKLAGIDAAIRRYYSGAGDVVAKRLNQAILYSVEGGGKRLRPMILLEILEGFGLDLLPAHFEVAAALEMIHTGSLIHDDLPAMDDDDYRRGRLTNHKQFDEATAILAGDSLFLDPFHLVASTDLPAQVRIDLVGLLARAAGTYGMVGGQALDMASEGQTLAMASLQQIHAHKTGALLVFPFVAAGILAGQSAQVQEVLQTAGEALGLAFQVRDDILDITADFEALGKTPQKDVQAEKSTYPALLGLDKSYEILNEKLDQACAIFRTLSETQAFQPEKILAMIERLRLHD